MLYHHFSQWKVVACWIGVFWLKSPFFRFYCSQKFCWLGLFCLFVSTTTTTTKKDNTGKGSLISSYQGEKNMYIYFSTCYKNTTQAEISAGFGDLSAAHVHFTTFVVPGASTVLPPQAKHKAKLLDPSPRDLQSGGQVPTSAYNTLPGSLWCYFYVHVLYIHKRMPTKIHVHKKIHPPINVYIYFIGSLDFSFKSETQSARKITLQSGLGGTSRCLNCHMATAISGLKW